MTSYIVGTGVEIASHPNVVVRFPELIGTTGVIESVPVHPSTWYGVRVNHDKRLVKLQTTAMKILKNNNPPKSSSKSSTVHTPATHNNRQATSSHSSGIAHFVKGVAVRILGTENVLQRVPHLVGTVGTVREVPVHPTTWFKIEFPDGAIVTFRPSAFKLASEPETEDDYIVPSKKGARAPAIFHAPPTVEHHQSDHENNQDDNNSVNGEWSVGCAVRIREGRLLGHLGEVVRQGNGWVQVMTEQGEISKRSHELESIAAGNSQRHHHSNLMHRHSLTRPRHTFSSFHNGGYSTGDNPHDTSMIRRSKTGRAIRAHPLYGDVLNHQASSHRGHGPAGHGQRRQPRVQTMFVLTSNGETGEIITSKTVLPIATPMQRVLRNKRLAKEASTMAMMNSEGGAYNMDTTMSNGMSSSLMVDVENDDATAMAWTTTALGQRARVASPGPTIAFVYDLERQEEDCPFKLIDLQARQAKRARLQALVEREADNVLGRPNLSQWLDRLHSALCAREAATPRMAPNVSSAWGQGLPTPMPPTLHPLTLLADDGLGVTTMGGEDDERMVVSATEDEDDHEDDHYQEDHVVDMEADEGPGLGRGLNALGEEDPSVVAVAEAMYILANCTTSASSSSSLMSVDQEEEEGEGGDDEEVIGGCDPDTRAAEEEEAFSNLRILSTQATTTVHRHIRPPSVATHPHHLQDMSHTSHTTTMSRNSSDSDLSDCLLVKPDGKMSKTTTTQATNTSRGALLTLTSLAECAERAARAQQSLGEYHYVPCQALRPRSDSMAETDVEEFSPELTAVVAGANTSPPPMMLPPVAEQMQKKLGHGQDDSPVYTLNTYQNNAHPGKGGFHWTLLAAAQASISPRSQALMQMTNGEGEGQLLHNEDEAV